MAFLADESKNILKRSLKHTEVHNKAMEIKKLWAERSSDNKFCEYERESGHRRKKSKRHKSESPTPSCSTFPDREMKWTQQLYEMESKMGDRWKHDGFKEHNPDLFNPKPVLDVEIVAQIFNPPTNSSAEKLTKNKHKKKHKKEKKHKDRKHKKKRKSKHKDDHD